MTFVPFVVFCTTCGFTGRGVILTYCKDALNVVAAPADDPLTST